MTRLARSEEGGLVLPGGQTGTLIANEDAFAREILGLPTAPVAAAQPAANGAQPTGGAAQPAPLLLLDNKPAAEAAAAAAQAAVKPEPGTAAGGGAPPAALAAPVMPQLAGEAELSGAMMAAMPAAGFFNMLMHSAMLPRGPPDFLRTAFDRAEPMGRAGGLGTGLGMRLSPVPLLAVCLLPVLPAAAAAAMRHAAYPPVLLSSVIALPCRF